MKQKQASFLVRHALQSFAVVLILGILLRTFLISSYVMSGWSMLPSIWPGDFLLASKWHLSNVQRGDVVALHCPNDRDQICLKRIVALAGDRVEFRQGVLIVNEEPARRRAVSDHIQSESLGRTRWLIWPEDTRFVAEPVVVPPGQVYLLNDKRSILEDSRSWGPVKGELIEGKVLRVWLSLDWFDSGQVRTWPRIRWARMFRSIN